MVYPCHRPQQKIADYVRDRRLVLELTQDGLSQRSGVPLATLRKFEQKGIISLESLLKLLLVVGGPEDIIVALEPDKPIFTSIDDVLKEGNTAYRKTGRRK
ncbi:XRE family transcriptional regulator [Sphingobacterium faecale]|uniref:XRE family transcriptional regulator n=1 Tax=Sphingobacterium faecale TaxID=2803775 RepID=A0ABS1R2D2_9SPHI|nr:XRE family transcriptional regulator [Sphingobacterium faecale]MBL1408861.1 XRE family transcriptional regulator [Sphingobacterium faecale]